MTVIAGWMHLCRRNRCGRFVQPFTCCSSPLAHRIVARLRLMRCVRASLRVLVVCPGVQSALRVEERGSAHVRDVTCVAFGRRRSDVVATGSLDGTLRLWDLSDYGTRQVSVGPTGVTCVAIDDEIDGSLLGGFDDGYLRCYEAGSGVRCSLVVCRPRALP